MQNIDKEPLFCTRFAKQKVCPILYFRDVKPFLKQILVFACLHYKSFENTVGRGDIARLVTGNSPFPTVFCNHLENFMPFLSNLKSSFRRV